MAAQPRHLKENIAFEWEEYPPESPESYRCQECGKRWQDTQVYPDPARKAWACRSCHSVRWVYAPPGLQIWTNLERRSYRTGLWLRFWVLALAQWLLLGLLFHTFAFRGSGIEMSSAERWAESLVVVLVLSVVVWIIAALITAAHAGSVERQHGWGPWLTWPYPSKS